MKLFSGIVRCGGAAVLTALLASAQLANAGTKPVSQTAKCTRCAMPLSTKKTAATPVAVKINGKTYYCCRGCGMELPKSKTSKRAPSKAAKAKPEKVVAPKAASIPLCPKCGMQMIASPTLLKKTPMVVNGKTYYCCTVCPRH
jgi:YHS domain-containing protein